MFSTIVFLPGGKCVQFTGVFHNDFSAEFTQHVVAVEQDAARVSPRRAARATTHATLRSRGEFMDNTYPLPLPKNTTEVGWPTLLVALPMILQVISFQGKPEKTMVFFERRIIDNQLFSKKKKDLFAK